MQKVKKYTRFFLIFVLFYIIAPGTWKGSEGLAGWLYYKHDLIYTIL